MVCFVLVALLFLLDTCWLLSHPGLGWLYVFSSFPPRLPPPCPVPQQLLPLTSKQFELNIRYLAQRIYGWQLYCLCHCYYLIRFWRSSVRNCWIGKFSLKVSDMFFQGQTLFWPYLRNSWSDWCETKMKCIGGILGTIYDINLWPHSWPRPWMFQGQI